MKTHFTKELNQTIFQFSSSVPISQSISTQKFGLHLFGLSIFLLLFLNTSAQALSLKPITLERAVRSADLIVYVTVGTQKVVTEKTNHGQRIKTLSELTIHQMVKGTMKENLVITQVGGTSQGLTQLISGSPKLKVGERWVLFLRYVKAQHEWVITGGRHGAQQVFTRSSDQVDIVKLSKISQPKSMLRFGKMGAQLSVHPSKRLRVIPQETSQVQDSSMSTMDQTSPSVPVVDSQATTHTHSPFRQSSSTSPPQAKAKIIPQTEHHIKVVAPSDSSKKLKTQDIGTQQPIKTSSKLKRVNPESSTQKLSVYLEQLKTLVDRTQAPESPTH